MWKTAVLLIIGLVTLPIIAFYFGEPPTTEQWSTIYDLLYIYLPAALLCFVISTMTQNYSQVDKLWSIIPVVYAWVIAYDSGFEFRILMMAILISLWGIRLTFNFNRRGGYSWKFWTGEEDYRWAILKARPEFHPSWKWTLFNLFFISLYQMGLILLITFPMIKSMGGTEWSFWDTLLSAILIFWIVFETLADQQQWNFQNKKYSYLKADEPLPAPYDAGFIQTGLWGKVRHPNYLAEQAIWITLYFFSVTATGEWINWSIVGCVLLIFLFWGSSDYSEGISAGKYPQYKIYQKNVGRFLPKL